MVKLFKKSVSLSDLWVTSNEKLSDFHASSWQRGQSPVPLLVMRLVLLAAALGILIWSLLGASGFWLIYLTNWGLLLLTLMTLSAFIVSCFAATTNQTEYAEVPWYVSTYWLLHNINIPLAFMITALYWTLLYSPEMREETGLRVFMLDVSTHGLNSCISFLELVMARTPVRALHFYQPLAVGLWYAAFTGIYYTAGGTDSNGNPYIYNVLDWRDPSQTGAIIGISIIALICLYFVMYGFTLCRNKISVTFVRTTGHDLPNTPHDHTRIA